MYIDLRNIDLKNIQQPVIHPSTVINKKKGIKKKKFKKRNKILLLFPNKIGNNCTPITRLLNKEYKFLILDNSVPNYEILNCLRIFGREQNYKFLRKFRIIYGKEKKKLKKIKKIYEKKGIKIIILDSNKKQFYLDLMYLYDTFYKNTFNNLNLDKDRFFIKKNDLKNFIIFSKKYKRFSKEFIKKMNNFLEENKIKQDIYKGWGNSFSVLVKSDGVKCNTYTLTQLILFNQFLEDKIYGFDEIIFTKRHFYRIFNSIDNYRVKLNKRKGYVGWTSQDILDYLNGMSWGIYTKKAGTKNFKFRNNDNFHLYKFLYVESGKYAHSGWKICVSSSECYMYFPDFGKYVKQTPTRRFMKKVVQIRGDIAPVIDILKIKRTN